ncbi:hypothetical protein DMUE_4676 [Dictyocoela muelleri]|nr:hypothetical protein DMUE_4676 [Dictyocoela muelleri]
MPIKMKIPNLTPRSTASNLFLSIDDALNYLLDENFLPEEVVCDKCGNKKILIKDLEYSLGACYKCSDYKCKSRSTIFKGKLIITPSVPLHKKMLAIYEFLNDDYVKRINYDCKISKGSIYNIKNKFISLLKRMCNQFEIL